jgi:hypothetical protein
MRTREVLQYGYDSTAASTWGPEAAGRHLFALSNLYRRMEELTFAPVVLSLNASFRFIPTSRSSWREEVMTADAPASLATRHIFRVHLTTPPPLQVGPSVRHRGVRHGPLDILARVDRGEDVDPSLYYMRTTMLFETSAEKYNSLNNIVAVATGARIPSGPYYDVYEVL